MAKKNSKGNLYAIVGIVAAVVLILGAYFLGTQKNTEQNVLATTTPPTTAGAISSAAYNKCIQNGGFVTTNRRGTMGYYSLCNFADDRGCDLYALYDGDCPVGGVSTIGYDTTAQAFCALRGGQPMGSENGQCKMPDGKTCSTSAVYQGACSPN